MYCWKILRLTDWLLKVYNLLASINWALLTFRLAWCLLSDFNCEVDDHFFNGYMLKKAGFYLYSATTLLIIFNFSRVHLILDCLLIFGGDMPRQVLLGRLHVVLTLDCFKILLQEFNSTLSTIEIRSLDSIFRKILPIFKLVWMLLKCLLRLFFESMVPVIENLFFVFCFFWLIIT